MNPEENLKYATILREEIQNLDQNQISGWIVDVREMREVIYTMIAGLNPLIQDGIVGFLQVIKPLQIGIQNQTNQLGLRE